jgi:hypothetical protein
MQLPNEVQSSYMSFESYPENLVYQGSFPLALQASRSRLDRIAPDLFIDDNDDAHVPFRDWGTTSQGKSAPLRAAPQA